MFIFCLLRKIEHVQIKCTILLGVRFRQELFERVKKALDPRCFVPWRPVAERMNDVVDSKPDQSRLEMESAGLFKRIFLPERATRVAILYEHQEIRYGELREEVLRAVGLLRG